MGFESGVRSPEEQNTQDLHLDETTRQDLKDAFPQLIDEQHPGRESCQKIAEDSVFGNKFLQDAIRLGATLEQLQMVHTEIIAADNIAQAEKDEFIKNFQNTSTSFQEDISSFLQRTTTEKIAATTTEVMSEKLGIDLSEQVGSIEKIIEDKVKEIPEEKYKELNEAMKKGDLKEILSRFSELISRAFDTMFGAGENGDSIDKMFNVDALDFTQNTIEQLATPKENIVLAGNGELEYTPQEGSLIHTLATKRDAAKNAGDKIKEVMYAAAYSKASDTLYAKVTVGENISSSELAKINQEQQFARVQRNTQPGDMIFFVNGGGGQWYDKLLQKGSSIPANHVGIVGENDTLYHSTMKTYDQKRNGVHKVPLENELKERGTPLNLLVVRTGRDDNIRAKVLQKADEMYTTGVTYDSLDAATSLLGLQDTNESKVNCGDFVNECFKASPTYQEVKRSGVPANLLDHSGFSVEYVTKYINS